MDNAVNQGTNSYKFQFHLKNISQFTKFGGMFHLIGIVYLLKMALKIRKIIESFNWLMGDAILELETPVWKFCYFWWLAAWLLCNETKPHTVKLLIFRWSFWWNLT